MRLYGRKSFVGHATRKKENKAMLIEVIRRRILEREAGRKATVSIDFWGIAYESKPLESRYYNSPLRNSGDAQLSSRNTIQEILYNNQLIKFNLSNKYLAGPEQIWLVESLIGKQVIRKALIAKKTIDNQFIKSLFKNAPFAFYLSADEAYLVSSDDELTQLDFGPLTKINALTALQQFGIAALEKAKEKTVVRL